MLETIGAADEPISVRWVVSAFTIVSWSGARAEITSAITGVKYTTDDFDLLRLLHAFSKSRTVTEVTREFDGYRPEVIASCIDHLIEAGILTSAPEPELPLRYHWDQNALAFHRRSRDVGFHKSSERQVTPSVAARRSSATIPLARGTVATGRDLVDVLDARRSMRTWPKKSISLQTFSNFLWLSARNRAIGQGANQDEYVSRPYPSGGAAYSLELYPVIAPEAVPPIPAGLYRYLPDVHGLEPVAAQIASYHPFLEAAGRAAGTAMPPIVLVVTSRFARQSEIYGELALSLVLKEVGCLFQTLYLVGEYLGLAACALGGGSPAGLLASLCNTNEFAEPVVGEFMLGPR